MNKKPLNMHEIESAFKGSFQEGNKVKLLWRGGEAFRSIIEAITQAENLICLQFYIFRNDETGQALSNILKEKVRAGVKVYLLYDHLGSWETPREFWEELRAAGINVYASHPFRWREISNYSHRDHRKFLIIDGTTAFTGGLNIANEYRGIWRKLKPWRDTGIILTGPTACALYEEFKRSWKKWAKEDIKHEFKPCPKIGKLPVIPVFTQSRKARKRMRKLFYLSINRAWEDVSLSTAYFIPSRRMVRALKNAVNRGARVRLIVPGKGDVVAAHYAGRYFFNRLLQAGVEIFTYSGEMMHAKTYSFDKSWSIIGSTNLDFRSLWHNDEGNVGIFDDGFTSELLKVFQIDLENSERIELIEWRKRPLLDKLKEWFFSRFRTRL